jgi:polysaccharide pyruvyl transferase WcaK-like protein
LVKESLDYLIFGSDQIWREEYSPKITDYFGGFLSRNDNVKLIAYAASFGLDYIPISQEKQGICSDLLRHFSAISVRENSAKILLRDKWDVESDVVLDPTLLLTKSDYENLISGFENECVQIFSYLLDENEEKKQIVGRVSQLLGQDVVHTFLYPRDKLGRAGKLSSMQEWLYNISKASFVVTDSYHGCLFSIIFNKPFVIIANTERGIDRFETILTSLNLGHRLIYSLDQVCESLLYERLDYKSVNSIIKTLRQESISFLKNSL